MQIKTKKKNVYGWLRNKAKGWREASGGLDETSGCESLIVKARLWVQGDSY